MVRTACTEPQCLYKGALYLTIELYLYSPYGPYCLYRASVPIQGCTLPYNRAIPLFPLWTVLPVQSLSACTRVHFTLYIQQDANFTQFIYIWKLLYMFRVVSPDDGWRYHPKHVEQFPDINKLCKFLILSFRRVLCFLLGTSPASEC